MKQMKEQFLADARRLLQEREAKLITIDSMSDMPETHKSMPVQVSEEAEKLLYGFGREEGAAFMRQLCTDIVEAYEQHRKGQQKNDDGRKPAESGESSRER